MFKQRSPYLRLGLINWLPRLLVTTVLPILIYRFASPHFSEVNALVLAALPSALLTVFWFLVRRKLSLLGLLSLGTITFKLVDALVLQNATLLLLVDPLLMGVLGLLLLGSLLARRPLLLALAASLAAQIRREQWEKRLREQGSFSRSSLTFLTGLAGVTLLLQATVHIALVFLLPVATFGLAPFLLLKRFTTYGLFGIALLVQGGYFVIQRHRSRHPTHEFPPTQQPDSELLRL